MKRDKFIDVVQEQLIYCFNLISEKGLEYDADEADRLASFKVAGQLEGETQKQALAGMMAKHTVSIYDMCQSDVAYPKEKWVEKITDHINYLLILRAMVEEEINE